MNQYLSDDGIELAILQFNKIGFYDELERILSLSRTLLHGLEDTEISELVRYSQVPPQISRIVSNYLKYYLNLRQEYNYNDDVRAKNLKESNECILDYYTLNDLLDLLDVLNDEILPKYREDVEVEHLSEITKDLINDIETYVQPFIRIHGNLAHEFENK